ncbi:MAG TPA: hypothetical protein VJC03_08805, partial [bacterium]|nr:hypothetical protein [bacterium]
VFLEQRRALKLNAGMAAEGQKIMAENKDMVTMVRQGYSWWDTPMLSPEQKIVSGILRQEWANRELMGSEVQTAVNAALSREESVFALRKEELVRKITDKILERYKTLPQGIESEKELEEKVLKIAALIADRMESRISSGTEVFETAEGILVKTSDVVGSDLGIWESERETNVWGRVNSAMIRTLGAGIENLSRPEISFIGTGVDEVLGNYRFNPEHQDRAIMDLLGKIELSVKEAKSAGQFAVSKAIRTLQGPRFEDLPQRIRKVFEKIRLEPGETRDVTLSDGRTVSVYLGLLKKETSAGRAANMSGIIVRAGPLDTTGKIHYQLYISEALLEPEILEHVLVEQIRKIEESEVGLFSVKPEQRKFQDSLYQSYSAALDRVLGQGIVTRPVSGGYVIVGENGHALVKQPGSAEKLAQSFSDYIKRIHGVRPRVLIGYETAENDEFFKITEILPANGIDIVAASGAVGEEYFRGTVADGYEYGIFVKDGEIVFTDSTGEKFDPGIGTFIAVNANALDGYRIYSDEAERPEIPSVDSSEFNNKIGERLDYEQRIEWKAPQASSPRRWQNLAFITLASLIVFGVLAHGMWDPHLFDRIPLIGDLLESV